MELFGHFSYSLMLVNNESLRMKANWDYLLPLCRTRLMFVSNYEVIRYLIPMKRYKVCRCVYVLNSMTSLLMHTVAHSTRPSFRLKTNNQLLKKFSSLAVSWVKVAKNGKTLAFKVNFLCQKLSESFSFFLLKNMNLGACLLLLTFFENFNF